MEAVRADVVPSKGGHMKVGDLPLNVDLENRHLFVRIDNRIYQIKVVHAGGLSWRAVYIMQYTRLRRLSINDYSFGVLAEVLYPVEEPCLPLRI